MKSVLRLLSMLGITAGLCVPAVVRAEETLVPIYFGVRFICNTETQVEEYVGFLKLGQDGERARVSVNGIHGNSVCGEAAITYVYRETVKSIPVPEQAGAVEIHKLLILVATDLATGETTRATEVLYQYAPIWVNTDGVESDDI